MSAVHEEYGRFLQWLRGVEGADDAKRIAKIVHANLDALIPTVSNGGQRATSLTPMLRRDLSATLDVIEAAAENATVTQLPWARLKRLSVGPFRGFRREEQFDLSSNIVLFQGPNGSGKSSLCEAIEWTLLGYVEEATAKRIDSLDGYFNNIHEGQHVRPQLWSVGGADGVPVAPNPELLRFAIIEKNRIEGFARLAARTPAQAGTLIASLFGLDSFNTFVGNFTSTLDNQLRLSTPKQDLLTLKRAALEAARQKVEGDAAAKTAFDVEQASIAEGFEEGLTFAQLLDRLGMHGQDGRLQQVHAALQEQIPAQSGQAVTALVALRKGLRMKLGELAECRTRLEQRAGQVSFLALYRSVQALQAENPDTCPACETPLANVVRNPFERAAEGLGLLQDLAALEANKARFQQECRQLSTQLHTKVLALHAYEPFDSPILAPLVAWMDQEEPVPAWTEGLLTKAVWQALLGKVRGLEESDAGIRERQSRLAALAEEGRLLEEVKASVDELRVRQHLHTQQVVEEQAKIDGFDAANAELIAEVAVEATARHLEIRIQEGYENFLELIKRYRDGLPEGLLADLNETTKDLYNHFNVGDHADDLLTGLKLPSRGGDRIEVAFGGTPAIFRDALSVLSEGHLRCLGLAILLAKNIKLGLPLVVFDDAVNAIDHDHRKGIRDTLFGDDRLRAKQMIITCHSNEFINQVQNGLAQGVSTLYILKHHTGDHQPRVINGSDRHYLRRAIERLENGDERQALASSRQALENLTAKTWRSLTNRDQDLGQINLLLRGPGGEPELRNIVDGLFKAITKGIEQDRLSGDAWVQRKEAFNELLAVPWRYLNKGTHDGDGEDFEIAIVEQIVTAIGRLSASFQ
ncbi:hypothetical protein EAH88_06695 [Rhodanobacter glycinis]|uniref:Rad50/SbcC-type AAA domain-containing protein n=1 Tax=Rhodanobacter glycinis TaxID=582702 RepID=A0A502CBD6_9GAMM|nr:AAA family ATPase [Rhodanobacter glycinis]TPG10052.1 hypothetical protein EAH88_06695 [Rhodanobacter glycinis]